MIEITITHLDETIYLTVSGHAEYEEHGKDIVCSAVSILTYTLISSLNEFRYSSEDDVVKVICDVNKNNLTAIKTVLKGYSALETSYPDNVKMVGGIDGDM